MSGDLQNELHSEHPRSYAVIRHGLGLGGKRLRPALLLLAGQAVGRLVDEHIVLAAVVEMIHTATLVHDDVLDEAAVRRHVDTVNARWNNETSVLLGDFLFTHAFYLSSTLDSTYACRTIGRSTNIVCDGELRQTLSSGDVNLSEEDYLAIVEAKTAELCACCCELGAHYAGGDAASHRSTGRVRPLPGYRLPDRRRPVGPRGQRGGNWQVTRHRPGQTQDDPPLDSCSRRTGGRPARGLPGPARGQRRRRPRGPAYGARSSRVAQLRARAGPALAERALAELVGLADSPAKDALTAMAEFAIARRG